MPAAAPRVVVAGLAGDSGKTMVALALALGARDLGREVRAFKKGPDYIDDDEHNKNQMLLGLGCVLVALGAPIIGFFGKKVDKGECHGV